MNKFYYNDIKTGMTSQEIEILNDLKDHFTDNNDMNEKYHFIIPSFFRMMISLKKQKRPFGIVFRTFGDDLPKIIKEFN